MSMDFLLCIWFLVVAGSCGEESYEPRGESHGCHVVDGGRAGGEHEEREDDQGGDEQHVVVENAAKRKEM